MEIAFVSSNQAKFREIRAILAPEAIRVRWHQRSLPEVQSSVLEEVVRAKLSACPRSKLPILVEDSGLFLSALGGFPGVYSRYALETIGLSGILTLLRGRPRTGVFRTVAGLRWGNEVRCFEGATAGRISSAPRGKNGFGYDPIFVPTGHRATFAEMDLHAKNQLSHRRKAVRAVARYLRSAHRES